MKRKRRPKPDPVAVRHEVAMWVMRVRAELARLFDSAYALHLAMRADPDGVLARSFSCTAQDVLNVAIGVERAEMAAHALLVPCEDPLPDPLAASRDN